MIATSGTRPPEPAPSRLGYRPELDGLRGIAILFVLFFHITNWFPGGAIGVDIFFVLSGFLITTLLLEERQKYGAISLRRFYIRRFLRLLPAMFTYVLAFLFLSSIVNYASRSLKIEAAIFSLTYTSNWAQAFGHPMESLPLAHLWSLAVEEQFYLLWPSALVLITRRRFSSATVRWVLIGTIAAVFLWRLLLIWQGEGAIRIYHGTDTRIDELLIGCLVGVAFASKRVDRPSPSLFKLVSVGTVIALLVFGFTADIDEADTPWFYGMFLPAIAAGIACLIHVVMTASWPRLNRALATRWLVYVGLISYALYLWHVLAIAILKYISEPTYSYLVKLGPALQPIAFVLTFVLAAASYHLVEMPFLRLKKRFQPLGATKTDTEAVGAAALVEGAR